MRFLEKKEVLTKKVVKTVGSITWPSFWAKFWPKRWPSYWPYHGQVIVPTCLTKKVKNQHLKIIKNPIFLVFFEQQGKKQQNSQKKTITLAHATITCLVKNAQKYFRFFLGGGVFFGFCFLGYAYLNNTTTQNTTTRTKKTPKSTKAKNNIRTTKTRVIGATSKTMKQKKGRTRTTRRK